MKWVSRRRAVLEPAGIFLLIMDYIWRVRYVHPVFGLAIVGLVVASHWVHRERAAALGFRSLNFRKCVEDFAPAVILLALLLLGTGELMDSIRPIGFDSAMLAWCGYLPWGLFQQYVLNGYFLNRLERVVPQRAAMMLSAALFSGVHLPNWFLMIVTLLLGYCSVWIYSRYRNLYFLGGAHATLGFLLYLVVPDSISHHLVVGPGWFTH
ncbi:MAG TPA: CPBP family intramembrane glutamic endopeptidase [Bryobacteraceae bacterium]|nr:CPBP family intramembrane glutamic endopeptidase [Bryobacteraceae bacterium]